MTARGPHLRRAAAWAVLGALLLGAVGLRATNWTSVFVAPGTVVIAPIDAAYHARRALYTFERFPDVLWWDGYLNHPDGAPVPWPPLYDWALGALGRAVGGTPAALDQVLAWAAPAFAALALLIVFAAGRRVGGTEVGLLAAAVYAVLPMAVVYASLGDPDHHAFVAACVAAWLAASLTHCRAVRDDPGGRSAWGAALALACVRVVLVLSWSGSLLVVAIGEAALVAAWVVGGRRGALAGQAAGAGGAALVVAPVVWAGPEPLGGAFSASALSWLHVAALAAVGGVAALLAWIERRVPAPGPSARSIRLAVVSALACSAVLLPEVRESAGSAIEYMGRSGAYARNAELQPLFPGRPPYEALTLYGWLAYAIPLLPLGAWLLARRTGRVDESVVLGTWLLALGALSVVQVRWGSDFAPVAAVGAAVLATEALRLAPWGSRWRAACGAVLALGVALGPTWGAFHAPRRERGDTPGPHASLAHFGAAVRAATPLTAGFLDSRADPAYGVLTRPNLGHAIRYYARRAVPADPFGAQFDPARHAQANRFYRTDDEAEAVAIVRELDTPFIVTNGRVRPGARGVAQRLQANEGSARPDQPHLRHFRLRTEGPRGGRPLLRPEPMQAPYKLFEVVTGAVIAVRAEPGTRAIARLALRSPTGRDTTWRAEAVAGDDGVARLRVPYPTGPSAGPVVHTLGPYRLQVGDRSVEVRVPERAVQTGTVITAEP